MEKHVLKNKTALITGGSRGIGFAIARIYAENGANVVIAAKNDDEVELAAAAAKINALGEGKCAYLAGDAADIPFNTTLINYTLDTFGALDIVVPNAGMAHRTPTLDMPVDEFELSLRVDLTSPVFLARDCIKHFLEVGGGKVLFVSSSAARGVNMAASPSYGAAKEGLVYITRHFAKEFIRNNINVNSLLPGYTATEITKTWSPERRAEIENNLPMGKMATPEDMAGAALYLVSDYAKFVTGVSLMVNGGSVMI